MAPMETVEQTKLRILREAVQDNIEGVHRIKAKAPARRNLFFPLWLWATFLIPGVAYLSVPTQGISTGNHSLPNSAGVESTARPLSSTPEQPSEDEVLRGTPRPLNRAVVPLAIKRVIIDPGHGGKQHGATSDSGVSEKEITLDIALRLRRLMEKSPFEVLMTRQSDQTLPLGKRVAFANENRADVFVSIHVNWMEPREIRPLETYYVGPSDDPAILELATSENHDSGYSMADYRRLLEKTYLDARRHESHLLAKTVNATLFQSLNAVNPELENRGVKMAPFVVLLGTQMPAILVEVSALSNEEEVNLLTNGDYREKIALALYNGIHAYAKNLNGTARKGS
jgi:N-acetylmuramoyl-L-alanine amidase